MASFSEWEAKPKREIPKFLSEEFSNIWVQQRLVELNLTNLDSVRAFINPSLYQPADPRELPDLEKAALRIQKAIINQETIGIWGDFDVDGQTSTTLLVQALRLLGVHPGFHIPNRDKESHGIRLQYLKEFLLNPIDLLITCDTGVSEHEAIVFCKSQGIDVIITDHHSLPPILPDAYAIINPQRLKEGHPLSNLAGVGTAYKLMEYVFKLFGRSENTLELIDLVALGTIADVAILNPENHFLVQSGIERIKTGNRLLIKEIFQLKEINLNLFNETHISFVVAPLLNALGRLDDSEPIVEKFLSDNLQETRVFANILDNLNEKRKLITEQITDATLALIQRNSSDSGKTIVLHHPDWHPGVLGIVANRLVEIFNKPVILLTGYPDQTIRGSGRSIEGVNIIDAIRESEHILSHFGGHAMAAGVSLEFQNLDAFKKEFEKSISEQLLKKKISPNFMVEDFVAFDQISIEMANDLSIMAPFGPGNPPFVFASRNVNISKTTFFGKNKQHLKFLTNDDHNNPLELLWWQGANKTIPDTKIDIAFQLSKAIYKGEEKLQIEIINIRTSENALEEIITARNSLDIIDLRTKNYQELQEICEIPDMLIWAEGLNEIKKTNHINRLNLRSSENLLIYTCPPSLVEIAKVWKAVNPRKLYLGNVLPETDSINAIILSVSGMIIHAVKKRSGVFDINRAAAVTGHRTKTIKAVLNYLASTGKITIYEHPDTDMTISIGGVHDGEMSNIFEDQLRYLLKETIYFRKWYQQVDATTLMNEITELFSRK